MDIRLFAKADPEFIFKALKRRSRDIADGMHSKAGKMRRHTGADSEHLVYGLRPQKVFDL
ncbi:Uncharacterised protein [Mycobacterium tuberculosis]|nr:Uncharacterised protein [Mycobacterium tuberculosis]